MTSINIPVIIQPDGILAIPSEFKDKLPKGKVLEAVFIVRDSENEDWDNITAMEFLKGYSAKDCEYDKL